MTTPRRLTHDPGSVRFSFDGTEFTGRAGDTLASALLANGRLEVAPSIYARRPRGIFSAAVGEPNALVQLGNEPMRSAASVELVDGMRAASLSGVGRLRENAVEQRYDKKFVHADVVVIGAGPAGIAAATTASAAQARVVLVDEQVAIGGALRHGSDRIGARTGVEWVREQARNLALSTETRVLTRATAIGCYDHNYVLIAQRHRDGGGRLWHVRAKTVVLATGAHERPIVFADNDRPGIMLAESVRTYLERDDVLCGERPVVFTNGDSAYRTVLALAPVTEHAPVIVDSRQAPPASLIAAAAEAGCVVLPGSAVVATEGARRVSSVSVAPIDATGVATGTAQELPCDLLAVSGGWSPVVHLYSHAGGKLRWDECVAGFVPRDMVLRKGKLRVVGAARGSYDLAGCLAQGYAAGAAAATDAGFRVAAPPVPSVSGDPVPSKPRPLWMVAGTSGGPADWHTHFVDMQRDSTVADIAKAIGAGMSSVEHIKRYTTISTGQDQGKTGAVNAIGVISTLLGNGTPDEVGTTTFRPPYAPVSFAALAGRDVGTLSDPVRTTAMHACHTAAGAEFENVGQWKRPWYYPQRGESMEQAVRRECRAARNGVAMMDASTLGKIEIVGADAPEFLNRIYTNGFAKLGVGKARYGIMCKADGMVFDDGVTMRLAEDRYLMSTTTGNAAAVLDWLEEWLQTEWPDLSVHCTSVTEQWAAVAVVGPDSRAVLADVAPGVALDAESFPFMSFVDTVLGNGISARIARISFSGELAFEVNVPSWYGFAVWEEIKNAGARYGIAPYGTETMHVLRAEKGFPIVGQDTDGTVTPLDLGMEWVVSKRKDFVGKRSLTRKDTARGDRLHFVGLLPAEPVPEGSALLASPAAVRSTGHVTSSYYSVVLERPFALAMLAQGRDHIGATVHLPVGGRLVPATVTEPIFYDPQGERRDGR